MYAEVIIPLALPKNYTWSVPEQFRATAQPGVRVEVGLGKNKKYSGVIKKILHTPPQAYETKDILNILDTVPVVFPEQLQFWEWIASYYMCSEGEVMAAALPAHFKLSSETILVFNEEHGEDFSDLDNDEFILAEALLIKKELNISETQELLDDPNVYPVIKRLIEKKVCYVWESLKETYSAKKETYITLHPQYAAENKLEELLNSWQRAPKQMEVLLAYLHLSKTQGEVTKGELVKKSGASDSQIKGLIEKQVIIAESKRVDRIRYLPKTVNIDFQLSDAQSNALLELQQKMKDHAVCLLHGITSSGKTQVYIRLMEEHIKTGKQVLYLLPEIALTSQIIRRLEKHFGGYIGIYHSKFSQNERIEIWNKIRDGDLRIILGARSALFLPFNDLGMIIVDEEHDTSYKQQDPAPRYNARDAAIYYGSRLNAKVILGSATPSVESYYNAVNDKYGLVELNERFGGMALPEIEIIDTKKSNLYPKEKVIVTDSLQAEITETLKQKKQVILFQNRRGYSPYQVCQVCGWIPHCRNCDVTLTFHKKTHKLHCHYCGTHYPQVHTCQACGSDKFMQRNFGTEKIEEQLEEIFPDARIARMDVDSIRGKHAHDHLIQTFEQGKIDLLVGTQMVVKGLDFENVQLVGVLDADSLLNFADFRVNERAFQLIEQVSGRAGRKDKQGKVSIQAANTKHPLLHLIREHNYKSFFEQEIEGRKRFFYPPFSRIILLTFKHKMKDVTDGSAQYFADVMKQRYGQYIVGPAEPIVNRIRNQFLMELLIKLPKDSNIVKECKQFILGKIAVMHGDKKYRSVVVITDVDH
jgi:primosomal protein N' (replication factor Y)